MNAEQCLSFNEMWNTAEMRGPILNSISSETHATMSKIYFKPEDSGTMYSPLPILNQIFNKAEKYAYSSHDSIKSSPLDDNTACTLIVASASNPDTPDVIKFNSNGKYECDINCKRYKSYKICSHTVAAAEHKSELPNVVEYF